MTIKHFLSESAIWQTTSEFVTPNGDISYAKGESVISVEDKEIINESWVQMTDIKRVNNYKIIPVSPFAFAFESLNPELGKQTGSFHVDRNMLFSKFKIEGTFLNGYEIIRREEDVCYSQGALYENEFLINTWNAMMKKKQ